jgi:hypothetical protein
VTTDNVRIEDLNAAAWNPGEGRRERMVRWILQHGEFDLPMTKGQVIFNLGRSTSGPAVSATFHPVGEQL